MKNKICLMDLGSHRVFVARTPIVEQVEQVGPAVLAAPPSIITCFKYNNEQCDLETFADSDSASDWMFKPFDSLVYCLVIQD